MRRTVIALSAAALTVVLGACGQGSSGSTGSSGSGQESGGAPFSDVASLVSSAGGSMDKKQSVKMTIETTGGPAASTQDCQADLAKTMVSCSGTTGETVTTPDAIYLKSPAMAGLGGDPSKPWMKMTIDSSSPMGQMMAQGAQQMQKMSDLESILPPGSTITGNAKESVNGQDATRYDVKTDLTKAAAEAPAATKGLYEMLTKNGVKEITQKIWIGSDQLPLKVESVQPPMTIMGQQSPSTTTTVTYQDWGQPVTITVPPASQVSDFKMPSLNIPQPPN